MAKINLGRLEKVELRNVWINEANDFTPWLAGEENLALLGEVLGIELELEAQEKNVGPFRADILCRDTVTGNWVLVENQIERTDHTHLGQIITYAAGLKAATIVWIADQFTDEHRSALDWLNEITDERINFFGLEIELWRIGDSPIAPKFNIVSQPNDWRKTVSQVTQAIEAGNLTETQQLQLDFWSKFKDYLAERKSSVRPSKPYPQSWVTYAVGRSNFYLMTFLNTVENRIGVILVIHGPAGKAHYHLLHQEKETIEQQIDDELEWLENPGKKESHVRLQWLDVDPSNREKWPEYQGWLADKLEAFDRAFRPRIKGLNAEDYDREGEDPG
jgi:hypothetical protein